MSGIASLLTGIEGDRKMILWKAVMNNEVLADPQILELSTLAPGRLMAVLEEYHINTIFSLGCIHKEFIP